MPSFKCTSRECGTIFKDTLDSLEREKKKYPLCPNCASPTQITERPKTQKKSHPKPEYPKFLVSSVNLKSSFKFHE